MLHPFFFFVIQVTKALQVTSAKRFGIFFFSLLLLKTKDTDACCSTLEDWKRCGLIFALDCTTVTTKPLKTTLIFPLMVT